MDILSIDQSLTYSAGVLIHTDCQWSAAYFITSYVFKPKSSGIYRLRDFEQWVDNLVFATKPDIIVRELHNQVMHGAGNALHSLGAIIDLVALKRLYLNNSSYIRIPVTVWKKFCTGKGNLKKDSAYLIHLNNFLNKTTLLDTSEGKIELLDDNVADALCMGITGMAFKMNEEARNKYLNKDQQQVIKKNEEVVFDYGVEV